MSRVTILVNDLEVEVRGGTESDIPLILSFIRSMAAFERLSVSATEETLREALFGEAPAAKILLVLVDAVPIGYVSYFFSFSTMVGKRGLWLDDVYLEPDFRGRGIGKALMTYLARVAIENKCGRFEWMVLDWNKEAIGFYERLKAHILHDWRICRLEQTQLPRIAATLRTLSDDGEDQA